MIEDAKESQQPVKAEGSVLAAQESYLAEIATIRKEEKDTQKKIKQQASLRSIQSVFTRITKGLIASSVVCWKMQWVRDTDLKQSAEVTRIEREFAESIYETERAELGKKLDDAERSLLQKATSSEEFKTSSEEFKTSSEEFKAEHEKSAREKRELEEALKEARKKVEDLTAAASLLPSKAAQAGLDSRILELKQELGTAEIARKARDTQLESNEAQFQVFNASEAGYRKTLREAACRRLKATLETRFKGRLGVAIASWRQLCLKELYGKALESEMSKIQENYAERVEGIKLSEDEAKRFISVRASLKTIQGVLTRLTKGVVASSLVNWRMQSAKASELASVSLEATAEIEKAESVYRAEKESIVARKEAEVKALRERLEDPSHTEELKVKLEAEYAAKFDVEKKTVMDQMIEMNETHTASYEKLQKQFNMATSAHNSQVQRLKRSCRRTKLCFLWSYYILMKRALQASLLEAWRNNLTCDMANVALGGSYNGGEYLDSEYLDGDSEDFDQTIDTDTIGKLWLLLLDLDPSSRKSREGSDALLRIEVFLEVCAVYAPEVSAVGIKETLASLGASQGRLSEACFQQWMSTMFTGCTDQELAYGVMELTDAVHVVMGDE